jgi:hypothetical protein
MALDHIRPSVAASKLFGQQLADNVKWTMQSPEKGYRQRYLPVKRIAPVSLGYIADLVYPEVFEAISLLEVLDRLVVDFAGIPSRDNPDGPVQDEVDLLICILCGAYHAGVKERFSYV